MHFTITSLSLSTSTFLKSYTLSFNKPCINHVKSQTSWAVILNIKIMDTAILAVTMCTYALIKTELNPSEKHQLPFKRKMNNNKKS